MPTPPIQRFVPMLVYKDCDAAIAFLCRAFGFTESSRLEMPDGRIGHAELEFNGHIITLASEFEEMGLASPQSLPAAHCQINCRVDDVDEHFATAKAEGATIVEAVADQFYGDRNYRAVDLEGTRWIFSTRMRDVSREELEAAVANMT